jgi:hypothetical protein
MVAHWPSPRLPLINRPFIRLNRDFYQNSGDIVQSDAMGRAVLVQSRDASERGGGGAGIKSRPASCVAWSLVPARSIQACRQSGDEPRFGRQDTADIEDAKALLDDLARAENVGRLLLAESMISTALLGQHIEIVQLFVLSLYLGPPRGIANFAFVTDRLNY